MTCSYPGSVFYGRTINNNNTGCCLTSMSDTCHCVSLLRLLTTPLSPVSVSGQKLKAAVITPGEMKQTLEDGKENRDRRRDIVNREETGERNKAQRTPYNLTHT